MRKQSGLTTLGAIGIICAVIIATLITVMIFGVNYLKDIFNIK